jgi:hypothetical protein
MGNGFSASTQSRRDEESAMASRPFRAAFALCLQQRLAGLLKCPREATAAPGMLSTNAVDKYVKSL